MSSETIRNLNNPENILIRTYSKYSKPFDLQVQMSVSKSFLMLLQNVNTLAPEPVPQDSLTTQIPVLNGLISLSLSDHSNEWHNSDMNKI